MHSLMKTKSTSVTLPSKSKVILIVVSSKEDFSSSPSDYDTILSIHLMGVRTPLAVERDVQVGILDRKWQQGGY